MKVTLHKALRIRSAIEEKLKSFDLKATIVLDVDSASVRADATAVVSKATADVTERLGQYTNLSAAFARLRTTIAKANAEGPVEALLAELGHLERQIVKLKALLSVGPTDQESLKNKVERKLDSLKASQASHYGYPEGETLKVNVLSTAEIERLEKTLVALRREKEKLEDERAAVNHRTDIEIGESDYSLLIEHGIV